MGSVISCDICVIGAGPAGTSAATLLSQAGREVLLLDKAEFPRPKLCAGLLTWKTMDALARVGNFSLQELKQKNLIHHENHRYGIWFKRRKILDGYLEFPFHLTSRQTFDAGLLKKAQDAGVTFIQEQMLSFDPATGEVRTKQHIFRPRILIGADGADSRLRRTLIRSNLLPDRWNHNLATGVEVSVPRQSESILPDHPIIILGCLPWGYGWSFPGMGDSHVFGLCGLNRKNKGRFKNEFNSLAQSFGVKVKTFKAHPLPYGNYLKTPGVRNVLLIGDAAGLADPLLGEGIYYAARSGELAAKSILGSDSPASAVARFNQKIQSTALKELRFAHLWRTMVFGLLVKLGPPALTFTLRPLQKHVEETIQGRRSFRFLRRVDPSQENA